MKKFLEIFLGVMTALGGFVDISEVVFTSQAGARFGTSLLWAVVFGTVGIIVYSEMCGRVAAVTKQPVFALIDRWLGRKVGFGVLVASSLANLATCAAEIAGVAIVLRLLAGIDGAWLPLAIAATLIILIWILPFQWIERVFGFAGLTMIVFIVAMFAVHPSWGHVARDLAPNLPELHGRDWIIYAYFTVGLLAAVMMPYEVYFYASGGIEDGWTRKDIPINRFITIVGFSLGSVAALALIVLGAHLFAGRGLIPDLVGTVALLCESPYGKVGLVIALVGLLTAIAGAAVETSLAGAYNVSQYFGWEWGRAKPARTTPAFDAAWVCICVAGAVSAMTGLDPLAVVECSALLAIVSLPFTFLPILLASSDRSFMGEDANGPITRALGWIFFVVVCLAALAAPPLLIMTGMGKY